MRRDLTFRQFLAEDDSEDIVSGLRAITTQIRTNWKTPYSSTRSQELKLWKKLSPAQQAALKQLFNDAVQGLLTDVNRPINTNGFRPTTKHEAAYIPTAFQLLAQGAKEIGKGVLSSAETRGIITDKQAHDYEAQFEGSKPMDVNIGNVVSDFITRHRSKLNNIVSQYEDEGVCFNVPAIRLTFVNAIESKETPPEKRAASVNGIHYLLLKMSRQLYEAGEHIQKKYSGAALPDGPVTSSSPVTT